MTMTKESNEWHIIQSMGAFATVGQSSEELLAKMKEEKTKEKKKYYFTPKTRLMKTSPVASFSILPAVTVIATLPIPRMGDCMVCSSPMLSCWILPVLS
jgi:hypothetical protein